MKLMDAFLKTDIYVTYKYKQELSLKRLVGRVEEINTTLDVIFQYLVIHCKINPRIDLYS